MFFDEVKIADIYKKIKNENDDKSNWVAFGKEWVWDHKSLLTKDLDGNFTFVTLYKELLAKNVLLSKLKNTVTAERHLMFENNLKILNLNDAFKKSGIDTIDNASLRTSGGLSFRAVNSSNNKLDMSIKSFSFLNNELPNTLINLVHTLKYFNELDCSELREIFIRFESHSPLIFSQSSLNKVETVLNSLVSFDYNEDEERQIRDIQKVLLNTEVDKNYSINKFTIKGCSFQIEPYNGAIGYNLTADIPGRKSFIINRDNISGLYYLLKRLDAIEAFRNKIEVFLLKSL